MTEAFLLGIDVGTTTVKAAAYAADGRRLASAARACGARDSDVPGRVEQDPGEWMQAIASVLEEVRHGLPRSECRAVGITSQVNTHVFADAQGTPLLPAISWQDQRCAESAETLNSTMESRFNAPLPDRKFRVDTSSLISRAHWVKAHRPKAWERTRYIFSPKDYCLFHLTGVAAADAISSIGLVDDGGSYLEPVTALVDGLSERLPPLRHVTELIGKTGKHFPFGRCPTNVGTMDAWACLYGSGAVRHGDAYEVAGTSEVIGIRSDQSFASEGIVTFPPIPGWYLHAGPTQLGGDAACWLADFLDVPPARVFELAAAAENFEEPLVFVPHLMGERAPFWDAKSKGMFAGFTRRHGQSDLAYAVLEGVAYAARALLGQLEVAAGVTVETIRISGGAARSDLWCQVKADVLDRRLLRLANTDTGTFGAAILAGVSRQVYDDVADATRTAVQIERAFLPRPSRRRRCDFLFERYLETYHALKVTCHELHDFALKEAPAGNGEASPARSG